jgi:hypothetical protein
MSEDEETVGCDEREVHDNRVRVGQLGAIEQEPAWNRDSRYLVKGVGDCFDHVVCDTFESQFESRFIRKILQKGGECKGIAVLPVAIVASDAINYLGLGRKKSRVEGSKIIF